MARAGVRRVGRRGGGRRTLLHDLPRKLETKFTLFAILTDNLTMFCLDKVRSYTSYILLVHLMISSDQCGDGRTVTSWLSLDASRRAATSVIKCGDKSHRLQCHSQDASARRGTTPHGAA
ncbi:unnamed protein product [Chrysodeixis includens]|uniref:Uncharacterized protein n=1 Tax=Chrysodeixis includens TaxID=689277 RepID=A0A9N8Q0N4_CHRIL|nr:unnamed protein product [Chrysodeixis includens]